jgi:hypothetical protein
MNTHEGRCEFSRFCSGARIEGFCVRRWMLDVERWTFSAKLEANAQRLTFNVQRSTKAKKQAGEGNRTLVCSLGSYRSTIELHPRMEEVNCDW